MGKGTMITARHIKSDNLLDYLVVEDKSTRKLRVVNMNSSNIMAGFEAKTFYDIKKYLIEIVKCEIVSIK
jgi:hypothetical protein